MVSTPRPGKRKTSPTDDQGHPSKRQQKDTAADVHPAFPPPRFWDNLSVVPFTRNALRELDRRNTENRLGGGGRVGEGSAGNSRRVTTRSARSERRASTSQTAERFLRLCSRRCLRDVQQFARHGGPDLRDTRGCPPLATIDGMSSTASSLGRRKRSQSKRSSQSASRSNNDKTTSTASTGPYDRAFQQHLVDHNILPDVYQYPDGRFPPEPDNMDEIRQVLLQRRRSLSPSTFTKDDFRTFRLADRNVTSEERVTSSVIPIIEGKVTDEKCVAGNIQFANLVPLTDGTLKPGNPDLYYGARPEQLNKLVRQELDGFITPSTQKDRPLVPNFFLHAKGPSGKLSVALQQASYDGSLGARGIHKLQTYKQPAAQLDNNAYTVSSTYSGGQLSIFTVHPIPPAAPNDEPGFVMTQIKAVSLTSDIPSFCQGVAAYRNGRDWAKKQRDDAIAQANERATEDPGSSFATEPSAEDSVVPSQDTVQNAEAESVCGSDTSTDELSRDFRPAKRSKSRSSQRP